MKLPRPWMSTKHAAKVLGWTVQQVKEAIYQKGLPAFKPEGRYRIDTDAFERWLFSTRNEEVLRKLGWEPSFLVASPETEIARALKEACLEDDIPILFASDLYSAGILCKQHCPVGIMLDYGFGDHQFQLTFASIREKWPWMKLFVAIQPSENYQQFLNTADKVFLSPVDPEAVRAALLGEDE